jgi:hypothetical protein
VYSDPTIPSPWLLVWCHDLKLILESESTADVMLQQQTGNVMYLNGVVNYVV